ncbi:MAG TPA: hypothetical protein VGD00_00560 [Solirubrobacteraceae bacterium]|jgi:cell division protein FtsL
MLGALEALSSHRLLDRLIRSRLWIGLIACALLGMVTLQLGLLKMNSGIGRSLERSTVLQRENAALSIENSELTSGERVESQAAGRLGMRLGSISGLRALSSHGHSDVSQAAAALQSRAQTSPPATSESTETTAESGQSTTESAGSGSSTATAGASAETGSEAHGAEAESTPRSASGSSGTSESGESSAHGETGATSESSATRSETATTGETGGPGGGTAAPGG